MIHIVAIAFSIAGFACFACAMSRHQIDLFGRKLTTTTIVSLRRCGGGLLLASLAIDMAGFGAGYGAVSWWGHLTIGAVAILAGLNWRTAHRARQRPR